MTLEAILSSPRRADLLVADDAGVRFTIEMQDSAISPDQMKLRERADQSPGCFATCWTFTDNRVPRSVEDLGRFTGGIGFPHLPLLVFASTRGELCEMRLATIDRPGCGWYEEEGNVQSSADYQLRSRFVADVRRLRSDPKRFEVVTDAAI